MRTRSLILSMSSAAALAWGGSPLAAQSPLMLVPLRMHEVMTPDQFARAGLGSLTPEQRLHLDGWLTRYSAELRQAVERPTKAIAGADRVTVRPASATVAAPDDGDPADVPDGQADHHRGVHGVPYTIFYTMPPGARVVGTPEEGGYVTLADGTQWEIYLPDRTTTVTWQRGDYVSVSRAPAGVGDFDHLLVNAPANARAYARFVGLVSRRGR